MADNKGGQDRRLEKTLAKQARGLRTKLETFLHKEFDTALKNLDWIFENLPPYFFITMQDEIPAVADIALRLNDVTEHRKVTLVDQESKLLVAQLDIPGSLYETAKHIQEREVSYAELTHSYEAIPGAKRGLEILRFEFERKTNEQVLRSRYAKINKTTKRKVRSVMKQLYPDYDFNRFEEAVCLLWYNNPSYVRISPPERIARALWLYERSILNDGLYLDLETVEGPFCRCTEYRLLFSVASPPERGFMTQISEVFRRLGIGVQRSYSLNISTGSHRQFIGTFYIRPFDGSALEKRISHFRKTPKGALQHTNPFGCIRDVLSVFDTEPYGR